MTYVSAAARRAETEPAEERSVGTTVEVTDGRLPPVGPSHCSWCGQPVRRHSAVGLALCTQAFEKATRRRAAGPLRVRDLVGRRV